MSQRVVSFHYQLTDSKGRPIDSSEGQEPLTYMEGAKQIIAGLEKALVGMGVGGKKTVTVPASEAYGDHLDGLVVKVPRAELHAPDLKVGDQFRGGAESHSPVFVVTQIAGEEVTLDGNHPLAGQDLTFNVEIAGVRAATEEEMRHGHAHGDGGHSH